MMMREEKRPSERVFGIINGNLNRNDRGCERERMRCWTMKCRDEDSREDSWLFLVSRGETIDWLSDTKMLPVAQKNILLEARIYLYSLPGLLPCSSFVVFLWPEMKCCHSSDLSRGLPVLSFLVFYSYEMQDSFVERLTCQRPSCQNHLMSK